MYNLWVHASEYPRTVHDPDHYDRVNQAHMNDSEGETHTFFLKFVKKNFQNTNIVIGIGSNRPKPWSIHLRHHEVNVNTAFPGVTMWRFFLAGIDSVEKVAAQSASPPPHTTYANKKKFKFGANHVA